MSYEIPEEVIIMWRIFLWCVMLLVPPFLAGTYLKYKKQIGERKSSVSRKMLAAAELIGRWAWRLFLAIVWIFACCILVKGSLNVLRAAPFFLLLVFILLYFVGCVIEFLGKGKSVSLPARIAVAFAHAGRYICWLAAVVLWIAAVWYSLFYAYVWPIGAKHIPYAVDFISHPEWEGRNEIYISLASPDIEFTAGDIALTCMNAGKYFVDKYRYSAAMVKIFDYSGHRLNYSSYSQLGKCVYAYGKDLELMIETSDWPWPLLVAPATVPSEKQRKINRLWEEMDNHFRKSSGIARLQEDKLKKFIAKTLGIPASEVEPKRTEFQDVAAFLLPEYQAIAPVNPERVAIMPAIIKARKQIWDFINLTDDLVRSSEFLSCLRNGYSNALCDQWHMKKEALESYLAMTPEIPKEYRKAVDYLAEYAMTCARGECADKPRLLAQAIIEDK